LRLPLVRRINSGTSFISYHEEIKFRAVPIKLSYPPPPDQTVTVKDR
jgi:hypothetical protein